MKSSWMPVTSDAPMGSILGPTLFGFFTNELDDGAEYRLSMFADVTKLGGAAGMPESHAVIQRDLDRLEK